MSRRVQLALLAAGAALFAGLVHRIGVAQIVANASAVGWLFGPILLLYAVAYACNTSAWRLTMGTQAPRPGFWRTYAMTVSGFSLNFVTPMVNAGGEPYRVAALAPWLGRRRAATSVVLHKMLNSLALLLVWITALLLGLAMLPRVPAVIAPTGFALGVVSLLAAIILTGHQRGGLQRTLDLLHRAPLLDRLARTLEPRRETLAEMDRQIADFYHASPRRFWGALALEYGSRALWMVEYWLICYGVGIEVTFAQAFLIAGLSSIVQNAFFFVPYELGTKEGSLYALFDLTGLDPRAGVYTAIVSRARDIIWIAGGLGLLAITRHRTTEAGPIAGTPVKPAA
ncbi:MAG TPA: lysylphosphatidylglycerol synthase transmembrane domain-containing protein [Gemmatimonadales bacterium]